MSSPRRPPVESNALSDFARVMSADGSRLGGPRSRPGSARIDVDEEGVGNGLAQLVLTLIKLVHELLERQALRRIDAGTLGDEEIERVGLALMRQADEIERLRRQLGLDEEDLNLDLGSLGRLL